VGDNVQLSATVLPDNATDKTVTWTKVSGNGAVSDSGVVTATAAGDVVVKATAGGVDSANYTVSFAAAVPADIVPAVADKDTYSSASTGLQDAFGNDVTIDSSRSYGAAKFENVVLDDGEYVYKVFATGTNKATGLEETKSWDVVDGSVELTGASVSFIAIVRSATHTITSVVLKAFAK
nr:Ig-like domain-containing protein [Bacillota bacterium]